MASGYLSFRFSSDGSAAACAGFGEFSYNYLRLKAFEMAVLAPIPSSAISIEGDSFGMDMRYQHRRQAPPITFAYQSLRGDTTQHSLLYWQHNTVGVQGREHTGAFASFSKARIVEVQVGADWLEEAAAPEAPDPLARSKGGSSPRIYFLGFTAAERFQFELLAAEKGMHVVPALLPNLEFCCCGPRVSWRELQQAFDRKAWVFHPQQLIRALETGELPEHHPWLF